MRHGSLFSGIGGFDLAAEWMGWKNVFHCEFKEFNQKILKHYWPNAISYQDIKTTDFHIHRGTIDILTGGFPCQPYSLAGKRKGDQDNRHLWPEMLRAIREIKPKWVVGENVYGLVNWSGGVVFEQIPVDLEAEGYQVWPVLLPACGVNAPHRRYRIWFVAHANVGSGPKHQLQTGRDLPEGWANNSGPSSNSNAERLEVIQRQPGNIGKKFSAIERSGNSWENWPTVSAICNGDDGLSGRLDNITFSKWRKESVMAGGNAIVPQVAYEIFKAIQESNLIFEK